MRISVGHFADADEPPQYAVLIARNAIAIVSPDEPASVTVYSIERLIPCTGYDMSAMISRWSDGTIYLAAPEEVMQ